MYWVALVFSLTNCCCPGESLRNCNGICLSNSAATPSPSNLKRSLYVLVSKFHQFLFMASFAISIYSASSLVLTCRSYRPFVSRTALSLKPISITASSASLDISAPAAPSPVIEQNPLKPKKTNSWEWKFKDNVVHIYYEEHEKESTDAPKNILMIPTISDVSTVEEWRAVAQDILGRAGKANWRATIVDWPGLGFSSKPKMDYDADVMEKFLVDFINKISSEENDLVVFGGGHAATIAVRAAKKGLVKPKAIAAVAPTWAGPLPIVFGRHSNMQTRYGLLRSTLRAPVVGRMMYNMLVNNEGAIKSQYKSHVYENAKNVTPEIVQSRMKLTSRKGSRYVPAAFLTGLLDPVTCREEFLELFATLDGEMPTMVMSTKGSPRRSKAEMEVLREAKGVSKFVEVPGALLPHEEYPNVVAEELYRFLQENFEVNA